MFGIEHDARRIAVSPARVDVVHVFQTPVLQGVPWGICKNAGFFGHLAYRRGLPRLVDKILGPGNGLPEVLLRIGTSQQKHIQCRRVDDHQHGLGILKRGVSEATENGIQGGNNDAGMRCNRPLGLPTSLTLNGDARCANR